MVVLKWLISTALVASAASATIWDAMIPSVTLKRNELSLLKRQNLSAGSPLYNCHDNCGETSKNLPSHLGRPQERHGLLSNEPPTNFQHLFQARPFSRYQPVLVSAMTPPSLRTTTTACCVQAQTIKTSGSTMVASSTPPLQHVDSPSPP